MPKTMTYREGTLMAADLIEAYGLTGNVATSVGLMIGSGPKTGHEAVSDLQQAKWHILEALAMTQQPRTTAKCSTTMPEFFKVAASFPRTHKVGASLMLAISVICGGARREGTVSDDRLGVVLQGIDLAIGDVQKGEKHD